MDELLAQQTDLYSQVIDNFENMLSHGQIDEQEFNQLKANAFMELQDRIADITDVQEEDIDELYGEEDEEYSDGGNYANFNVGSYYGAALLELGDAAGYDDIESYCIDLAEATGYDPEDLFAVITGEVEPSDELSLDISNVFGLDEDLEAQLLLAGIETRGEDINDYLESDDEDIEDEEYDDSDYLDDEEYSDVRNELAEFKLQSIIKDELADVEERCFSLVDQGLMPPNVAEVLLGDHNDRDKFAAFSTLCNKNSVSPETQLFALNTVIKVFEHMPPMINFGYEAEQYMTDEEFDEEQDLRGIAANYVKNLRLNQ